jgi:hypothetical protein
MPRSSSHFSFSLPVFLLFLCVGLAGCSGKAKTEDQAANITPQAPAKPAPTAPAQTPPQATTVSFTKPDVVKGIYLTAWSAGSKHLLTHYLKLIDSTELNAVVIDVRDSGQMYWPTGIKLADEVEGKQFLAVSHPDEVMKELAAHKVWPIARIACFRDNYVPLKHPDRAVQLANGKVWKDRSGHMWLDPYDKRNWDYLAQTVDYAMSVGFPEIQLDYVRFPSEGKSKTQVFTNKAKYGDPKAKPEDVIAAFANFIRNKVKAHNCQFSADIFGIISSSKSDQGIGQELEKIAAPFDAVSPMVYPSHFAKGEYGIPDPNKAPYAIILKSLTDYKRRIPDKDVRPWLQDFSLFGVKYGGDQVRAQIKAEYKVGYKGFLLWNAGNHYTTAGLMPKHGDKVMGVTEAKPSQPHNPLPPAVSITPPHVSRN